MSYFDFIHDIVDARNWRESEMSLMWSEKENPLFKKEQCDIWENYANSLLEAVEIFRKRIGD